MSEPTETGADGVPEGASDEGNEALSVLRGMWSARGQTSEDVGGCSSGGNSRSCKNTDAMNFNGLIEEMQTSTDTDEAIPDVQSAWRMKLEQDGKLNHTGAAIGDLVLGRVESDHTR